MLVHARDLAEEERARRRVVGLRETQAIERDELVPAPVALEPLLFFVGAAIEPRMAQEIYDDLEGGLLTHAANLTVPEQVEDLAAWLVAL